MLSEALIKSGRKSLTTREPGGTTGAEAIRELLVNGDAAKWNPPTELLLHLAARSDHIYKLIMPKLKSGNDVICDRFTDSTIAYQAYGHELGQAFVGPLCNMVMGDFQPNLTIILDIEVEKGIARAGSRGATENRYETMGESFHKRVREGFLAIAKENPQRCVVISAENDIDSIHSQIINAVDKRLGMKLS